MSEYVNVSLQEEVPEHVLRTEDDFSSASSDNEKEGESAEESEFECDHEEFESEGNLGWADVMNKILKINAPTKPVLAKAKKLSDVLKKKKDVNLGFEIDEEIKEEKPDPDLLPEESVNRIKRSLARRKKREWQLKGRIKPCILEKNRERTLSKIATKGVVRLFNSVRDYQKTINKKLNEASTERKKDRVMQCVDKKSFLDMLMGPIHTSPIDPVKTEKQENDEMPWKALREDLMIEGELKDWDKKLGDQNLSRKEKEELKDIKVI